MHGAEERQGSLLQALAIAPRPAKHPAQISMVATLDIMLSFLTWQLFALRIPVGGPWGVVPRIFSR